MNSNINDINNNSSETNEYKKEPIASLSVPSEHLNWFIYDKKDLKYILKYLVEKPRIIDGKNYNNIDSESFLRTFFCD